METQQQINETTGYIRDRNNLTREINLLHHVLRADDADRTDGQGRGEEHPGQQADEQVQVKLLYVIPENRRKYDAVYHQLQQRIQEGPQKA